MKCEMCNKEFINNLSGQFTNHLLKQHNLSMEDYVVLTEYYNIPPICKCGMCNESPLFDRGKFSDYALNHNTFEFREHYFIKNNGIPKCLYCGKEVNFHRGIPKKYCSSKCSGKGNGGFVQPGAQDKVKESLINKYGVDHVSKIDGVSVKISKSKIGKVHTIKDKEKYKENISKSSKKKWEDPIFRDKTSKAIKKSLNQDHIKKQRSDLLKERIKNDPSFREKSFLASRNRLSNLHKNIRKYLNLDLLGFISECRIDRYFVDELNIDKKIIIEINGDYTHGNPILYKEDDEIILWGQRFFAKDKWAADLKRKEILESLGYVVFVIWQSDNLDKKLEELNLLLQL